jgi:hypothetical protein
MSVFPTVAMMGKPCRLPRLDGVRRAMTRHDLSRFLEELRFFRRSGAEAEKTGS